VTALSDIFRNELVSTSHFLQEVAKVQSTNNRCVLIAINLAQNLFSIVSID